MKSLHHILFFSLSIAMSTTLAMDDMYEQFKDAQIPDSVYEDVYTYLHDTKKLSEAEILELSQIAPKLITRALQDCADVGKLSEQTLEKMLVYVTRISRSVHERTKLTDTLKNQTHECGKIAVLILKAKKVESEQFQEFVLTRHNASS